MKFKMDQMLVCIDNDIVNGMFKLGSTYKIEKSIEMYPHPPKFAYIINDDNGNLTFLAEEILITNFKVIENLEH
jgi:hypothetical protein